MLDRLRLWIRSQLLRRRLEREMQAEMADHLDRATTRLMARGLDARDARAAAIREFGNVTSHQEQGREARGWRWLYTVASDLRFALRHFGKRPAVTATIVFVLAVGISVGTMLFSFVHSYAHEPPPGIARAEDMVRIRGTLHADGEITGRAFTLDEVRAQSALTAHFRQVAGWMDQPVFVSAGGDTERRAEQGTATFVTEDYFAVLGVQPTRGVGLTRADFAEDAPLAGVLSHGAWQELFGGRADIVGRTVVVDGVAATIVGVTAPRFGGVTAFSPIKVWLPLTALTRLMPGAVRDAPMLRSAARLQAGTSAAGAAAAVAVVAARAVASSPKALPAPRARGPRAERGHADVIPLVVAGGDPHFEQDVRMLTACFTGLGLLVLLVTCTNVSALVAGLGIARRKEVAIRLSMGAARARVVRQLLTESTLLAVSAGLVALGVVWAMQRALVRFAPDIPITVRVSWPATLFAFGIALAVGVAFGLSPALHATRLSVAGVLKESASMITASGARMQRWLVVAQIAFTQPLVVGIAALGLIVSSAYRQAGFSPTAEQIVSLKVRMMRETPAGAATTRDSATARASMQADARRLRERLERVPGVTRVVPEHHGTVRLDRYGVHPADRVPGGSEELLRMAAMPAAPGFFDLMGIPVIAGREFDAGDTLTARTGTVAVIVGDALARQLWPDANPIGRRLMPLAADPDAVEGERPILVVRGVADQTDDDEGVAHDGHRVSIPARGDSAGESIALLLRTRGDAGPMMPTIRRVVSEELPIVASIDTRTLKDLQADVRNAYLLAAVLLGTGGTLALLIAAIGLYAVVALAVGQRTGEIAVRMAVGARSAQIARRFVREGVHLGVVGLAIGLPLSLVGLRVLLSVPELMPPVGLGRVGVIAGACVMLVAAAAAVIPARRAASVDPAIVLRGE